MTDTQCVLWWVIAPCPTQDRVGSAFSGLVHSLLKTLEFAYRFFSHKRTVVTEYRLAPCQSKVQRWAWSRVVVLVLLPSHS